MRPTSWMTLLCAAGIAFFSSPSWAQSNVSLTWTTPGDDGMVGTAAQYDVRWSLSPLTAQNFASATRVLNTPNPTAPTTTQTLKVTGLLPTTSYYFAVKTADESGNWSVISNVIQRTTGSGTVGVDDEPLVLSFSAPYPNPARSAVRMSITMPTSGDAVIQAYDITGRLVQTISSGALPAGRNELRWSLDDANGRSVPSGAYIVLARVGEKTFTKRITVIS